MKKSYTILKSGFQPTYKELKLIGNPNKGYVMNSFQPTYKELKHSRDADKLGDLIGFQPTYKELKLPGQMRWWYRCIVFSLPIRN